MNLPIQGSCWRFQTSRGCQGRPSIFSHTKKLLPPKLFGVCENSSTPFPGGLLSEIPLGAPGFCVKWSFDATSYSFDATLMPLDDTVTVTVTLPHCVIGVVDEDLRWCI